MKIAMKVESDHQDYQSMLMVHVLNGRRMKMEEYASSTA